MKPGLIKHWWARALLLLWVAAVTLLHYALLASAILVRLPRP
jgi:hypothetical protein